MTVSPNMRAYFAAIADKGGSAAATDQTNGAMDFDAAVDLAITLVGQVKAQGGKVMVVGNGGSAAIASHIATDYSKNGGVTTQAFNDGALLTCLANDLGYENAFARAVSVYGRPGDLLIAISSSGRSPNVLNAVTAARDGQCRVVTLSGFDADNPLRRAGDINFHVASHRYGFVEIIHLAICHAVLDMFMGLPAGEQAVGP